MLDTLSILLLFLFFFLPLNLGNIDVVGWLVVLLVYLGHRLAVVTGLKFRPWLV